jgi:hypothetical protein
MPKKHAYAFNWVIKYLMLAVFVIVNLIARNKGLVAKLMAATCEIDLFRADKDFSKNLSDLSKSPTGRPHDEEISSIRQRFQKDHSRIEKNLISLKRVVANLSSKNGSNTDKERALEAENACLRGQLTSAKNQIKYLENKMAAQKANSKNSHLPPSKDLNGGASLKLKEKGATKKKRGAQEGHIRRARTKFTPEEADRVIEYEPEDVTCPCCNEKMVRDPKNDSQFVQLEISPISLSKIIHKELAFAYPKRHATKKGSIPQEVKK